MDTRPIAAELARRELARRSYADYLAYTGGENWKETRFSRYVAEQLQRFIETDTGDAYDILVLESPPQHGKSMTVTEALPSYCLGRNPHWRVILVSYNDETAERFARRNKEKLASFGRSLFGVSPGGVNRATEFELKGENGPTGGRLISRGIRAGITGNSANLLIIDDPIKNRAEADSPQLRQQIWEEWLHSMKSRLAAGAKVVVIMTPWHEDDLAARLMKREERARLIRLPVEAEEDDPMGRLVGESLCPELGKGETWLRQFKASYLADSEGGPRAWAALYQCRPRPEGGHLVHRSWWKTYDPGAVQNYGTQVISVDAAFKGEERNDYVAIQVWGKRGNDYYLRYSLNRHLDFPQTLQAISAVQALFPQAKTVLIEDKANGSAILQTLRRQAFCIGVDPKGGKVARVNAVSPAIESGHVFLPAEEGWVADFVDQFTAFPAGKHDDMVDAATQALSYLFNVSGITEVAPVKGDREGQALSGLMDTMSGGEWWEYR